MYAVAAGGILAGAVAAYLRPHEPASARHHPRPEHASDGVERSAGPPASVRLWHPWVRISRAFRSVLSTRWDATTWPTTKAEMTKALELRRQIRRAGWFN